MISSTSKDTWKYAYLSVWLLLINVKTAEPIGPKFLCAGSHDPREGLWRSQTLYKQNFKSWFPNFFDKSRNRSYAEAQLGGGQPGPWPPLATERGRAPPSPAVEKKDWRIITEVRNNKTKRVIVEIVYFYG